MSEREYYVQGRKAAPIIKALSNETRLQILDYCDEEVGIQELTEKLGVSKTAVLAHIKILEEAGFIHTRYIPGAVGNQRVCRKMYDRLVFDFSPFPSGADRDFYEVSIRPGNYFDFLLYPPCGLATTDRVIDKWDDPSVFYMPERVNADILWCSFGFVEYRIPLNVPFEDLGISKLEIILELSAQGGICGHKGLALPSHMPAERLTDGVSDVSFEVEGKHIGDVRVNEYSRVTGGKYTPTWWKGSNYGKLVNIVIDAEGTFIDGEKTSNYSISDIFPLNLVRKDVELKRAMHSPDALKLKIGIREDAECISGFNIFGQGFGHHSCDIVVRYHAF